ncbi:hypothetical protein [Peterkaempfera griseoplana]|uniref:hypothetical protein n=1 Tax=Peterkaempfera griseoplana TaxID=66896 RepID=UPI0006E1DC2D|nr:hypothetical protein [Peterkaempfera griseoplana]
MDDEHTFATWLRQQTIQAGYNLSGARSGGRSQLAKDAGVALTQVMRALDGTTAPDIGTQRAIAYALAQRLDSDQHALFREMLLRSGTLRPEDLDLPEDWAAAATGGIDVIAAEHNIAPENRQLFAAAVESVAAAIAQAQQTGRSGSSRRR